MARGPDVNHRLPFMGHCYKLKWILNKSEIHKHKIINKYTHVCTHTQFLKGVMFTWVPSTGETADCHSLRTPPLTPHYNKHHFREGVKNDRVFMGAPRLYFLWSRGFDSGTDGKYLQLHRDKSHDSTTHATARFWRGCKKKSKVCLPAADAGLRRGRNLFTTGGGGREWGGGMGKSGVLLAKLWTHSLGGGGSLVSLLLLLVCHSLITWS